MEKYEKAQMEVIEFENEDVITTSGCDLNCPSNAAGGCSENDIHLP